MRLRNDGLSRYTAAFSRRGAPEVCVSFTLLEKEGRRESRAPIAPAVVHAGCTSGPQVNRIIRLSLHDGLRLIGDLPGEPCTLATVAMRIDDTLEPGWAGCISTRLDASLGASGPHHFAVRACLAKALAGPRAYPASFVETVLKRRPSTRRPITHGVHSALRSLARPTLSRPSHPTARSCVRETPLVA